MPTVEQHRLLQQGRCTWNKTRKIWVDTTQIAGGLPTPHSTICAARCAGIALPRRITFSACSEPSGWRTERHCARAISLNAVRPSLELRLTAQQHSLECHDIIDERRPRTLAGERGFVPPAPRIGNREAAVWNTRSRQDTDPWYRKVHLAACFWSGTWNAARVGADLTQVGGGAQTYSLGDIGAPIKNRAEPRCRHMPRLYLVKHHACHPPGRSTWSGY